MRQSHRERLTPEELPPLIHNENKASVFRTWSGVIPVIRKVAVVKMGPSKVSGRPWRDRCVRRRSEKGCHLRRVPILDTRTSFNVLRGLRSRYRGPVPLPGSSFLALCLKPWWRPSPRSLPHLFYRGVGLLSPSLSNSSLPSLPETRHLVPQILLGFSVGAPVCLSFRTFC